MGIGRTFTYSIVWYRKVCILHLVYFKDQMEHHLLLKTWVSLNLPHPTTMIQRWSPCSTEMEIYAQRLAEDIQSTYPSNVNQVRFLLTLAKLIHTSILYALNNMPCSTFFGLCLYNFKDFDLIFILFHERLLFIPAVQKMTWFYSFENVLHVLL
jgi:hypothetical protein